MITNIALATAINEDRTLSCTDLLRLQGEADVAVPSIRFVIGRRLEALGRRLQGIAQASGSNV